MPSAQSLILYNNAILHIQDIFTNLAKFHRSAKNSLKKHPLMSHSLLCDKTSLDRTILLSYLLRKNVLHMNILTKNSPHIYELHVD